MAENNKNWYLKQNREVTGPFSKAVITNHVTVGRVSAYDEVSLDQQIWLPIYKVPELMPGKAKEELDLARRKLDERTGLDRRTEEAAEEFEEQREGERRQPESRETESHRALRRSILEKHARQRQLVLWPLMIVLVLFTGLAATAFLFPTLLPEDESNCTADAAPHVNWANCLMPKLSLNNQDLTASILRNTQLTEAKMMNNTLTQANMSYANFRFSNLSYSHMNNATMVGVDLTQADLSHVDLSGTDLSFANLTGAVLIETNLSGSKLDNAIWVDGQICGEGSVGGCLLPK